MEEQPIVNNQIQQPPVNPVTPKPNHWLIAIIILVFILIAGGVYALALKSQKQTPVPIPLPLDTSVKKENPTAIWKTYRNEKYGFELRYPPEWKEVKGHHMHKFLVFETTPSGLADLPSFTVFVTTPPEGGNTLLETYGKEKLTEIRIGGIAGFEIKLPRVGQEIANVIDAEVQKNNTVYAFEMFYNEPYLPLHLSIHPIT